MNTAMNALEKFASQLAERPCEVHGYTNCAEAKAGTKCWPCAAREARQKHRDALRKKSRKPRRDPWE
jgi:hypothetical protein